MKNGTDVWIREAFSREAEIPGSFSDRLDETCGAIRRDSRRKDEPMNKHTRRPARTALIWAAAAIILSLSAFAVYQHTLGDAVLPEPTAAAESAPLSAPAPEEDLQPAPEPAADGTAAPEPAVDSFGYGPDDQWLHMSLNGFSDSPEYKAYAEWTEWNDAWWAENPDPWAVLGEDDTYFETPENYAYFYDAYFPEQGEKLGEILDKYDLKPHTARCGIESAEDLCGILGRKELITGELPLMGGYMYDDGSFKIEGGEMESDSYRDATVFLAVKGSFSMISGFMPADYEEWIYTTADGTEVLLALGRDSQAADVNQGCILAELEGCYVYAGFSGLADKTELERCADGIAFAVLDERFAPGADTSDITELVEARAAEERVQMEQDASDWYAPFADKAERDAAVFAELGHYTITDLPEGYAFIYDSAEWKSDRSFMVWDASGEMPACAFTSGGSTWRGDDADGVHRFLHLSYQRYYDLNDLETVVNDAEFESAKAYYRENSGACTETKVNGCDALLLRDLEGINTCQLVWFDTDRGLQFTLAGECFDESGNVDVFSDEELIAMAESVMEG